MLKTGYANGPNAGVPAILRNRTVRNLATWILFLVVGGSILYFMSFSTSTGLGSLGQAIVYIHKTAGEIDVQAWPEDRWYVGPRNESQLEKAALIMLVRYALFT
jgi:hypothetical protein